MRHVGRFAPSPTGDLHWGSLLVALGSWLEARAAGGRWLLRIEDVDTLRAVPGSAARQQAQLAALGLIADALPWVQSTRGEVYAQALQRLAQAGHAYPCACTRGDLADHGGVHSPRCVRPVRGDAHAWRLRVPAGITAFDDALQGRFEQNLRQAVGDFVLRRTDGLWAYQLAVVVDDAAAGVTDVVRGADLLDSTPRQILLQRLLGLPTPRYLHLPVLVDATGRKLSKSAGATTLPADPVRALRVALQLLGQTAAAAAAARDQAALLAHAVTHYDRAGLPRARTLAAPQTDAVEAARTLAAFPDTRNAP
ncbi:MULTISPECIES: tRNA glutamyl-Q(34) synthetase GluQRS [Metallibacterium]|uniref:tRNA glutamyl-Q(34) synthetase GluQRS n=1 Tax=Metallibacterium TaxID=1218803 RepID=UPI0026306B9E|nr:MULTISPECIES: tRNA glutamyl-Q(34) synthetase GluQRS [Metallibacterium]MBW8076100.1 tRNA glutamyl-Q(34) synthetase GluQRS [Metallibacterium scheffleri]